MRLFINEVFTLICDNAPVLAITWCFITQVVSGIAEGCLQSGAALIGTYLQ